MTWNANESHAYQVATDLDYIEVIRVLDSGNALAHKLSCDLLASRTENIPLRIPVCLSSIDA